MIITRTPFRMSYVGGGTDIRSYYQNRKGAVLSTSINKYMYITLHERFDKGIRISYSRTEEVASCEDIDHPLVREALRMFRIYDGVEITSAADIPSSGSGLGSSSSYTVGLLSALHEYKSLESSPNELAKLACKIEIDLCKEPNGKQDQFAAAFGGLNLFEFLPDESVNIIPIKCDPNFKNLIDESTLIFYTGLTRPATSVLKTQDENNKSIQNIKAQECMVNLVYEFKSAIESGNLLHMAEILKENWSLKKTLASSISNDKIDSMYQSGINAGALAGKLLGAGAGGFLMFFAHKEDHAAIELALGDYKRCYFSMEEDGTKVIYND
jgi:D-glycero-alpha-D-manno-heptose-7-phosphate kinase